ncbi:MAG: phosphatase PAP2 family protein [Krumholzibacteria bacterium]|nr:phosphatase PAP2 family protein [Candidatus Krumholzibacteria bacterium]
MSLRRQLVTLSLRRMDIDRWAVVYLLASAFYTVLGPGVVPDPWSFVAVHAVAALAVWFVPPLLRGSRWFLARLAGDIYLPLLFPLFYAELEYLGLIFFAFESSIDPALISLEQWIFGFQPSLEWSRVWPWPWFHELMEFAYFSYYFLALAFLVLVFRARGVPPPARLDAVRDFVRDLSVTMLVCYTFYTILPAWGPKYFRAGYVTVDGWVFTAIMRHLHENGALLGAAFPSSHVAGSLIPWWHTWKWFPRHRWWMTTLYVLLCMSTVYNRYHYVVDVLAGLLLGVIVLKFGAALGDKARDAMERGQLRDRLARARRLVKRTPRS